MKPVLAALAAIVALTALGSSAEARPWGHHHWRHWHHHWHHHWGHHHHW